MKAARTLAVAALAACLGGCAEKDEPAKQAEAKPLSSPQQVINAMAGKTAVDQGQKAKETLRKVSAQQDRNLEDAMGK